MSIIRCVACRETFDTPPGYLSHECELPADVRLDEAIARAEMSVAELDTILEDYGFEIDEDETTSLVRAFEIGFAVGAAAVVILAGLVVDRIVSWCRS